MEPAASYFSVPSEPAALVARSVRRPLMSYGSFEEVTRRCSSSASGSGVPAASCAVPWIFRPVPIGDALYVDGGVWSLTNLDTAPAGRDSEVLCLSVAASIPLALSSPLGLVRAAARSGEAVESLALRRRGARVRTIGPDPQAAEAVGANLMDERRAPAALAAGYRQGLRAGGR